MVFGGPDKPGVAPLVVLDSFRLQATVKTAQATSNERAALRARVFDVDMLGSNGLGESILHDSAESAAQTSAQGRSKPVQIPGCIGRTATNWWLKNQWSSVESLGA